jgi:hypothetical protein
VEPEVRGARTADLLLDHGPLLQRGLGVPFAQPPGVRGNFASASGLRVDDGEQSDSRQLQFARVDGLHGENLMAVGHGTQGLLPAGLQEVGDDGDQAAPPGQGA